MATMYCALCHRSVEARRRIGVGTVILAVPSGGVWLLAIPFYAKRCPIRKSTAVSMTIPESAGAGPLSSLPARIADLEERLTAAEGDLDATNVELERMKTERDFYQQLRGDPTGKEIDRPIRD